VNFVESQTGLRGLERCQFFCESEKDCTSEMGAGQFRFLVQLRKNVVADFRGGTRMKEQVRGEGLRY
jgi:hypothetical protein